MKYIFGFVLFSFCFTFLQPTTSFAAKRTGLGIIIGAPTGLSGNYKLSRYNSVDAALAWDLGDDKDLHIHSTYLWHRPNSITLDTHTFGWYYGVGGKFRTHERNTDDDDILFGPRGSIGALFPFDYGKFEIFLEGALFMGLIPDTDASVDLGIGGRIYF